MPRRHLIRQSNHPYHVTCRTNNKNAFFDEKGFCWTFFEKYLGKYQLIHDIEIIGFVMMSNHYHLLIRTPLENLDKFMHNLNNTIGKIILHRKQRINHLFGSRYAWSVVKNEDYYYNVYKYIYLNPVKAGLVDLAEDYPYSTLFYLTREKRLKFKIDESSMLRDPSFCLSIDERLAWVAEGYTDQQDEVLRRALSHRTMKFTSRKNDKVTIASLGFKRIDGVWKK